MRLSLTILSAAGAAFIVGCGGSGGGGTGGTTSGVDMGASPDLKPMRIPPALYLKNDAPDAGTPANFACLGSFADPAAPTVATAVHGTLEDFQDSNLVVGATVSYYKTTADVFNKTPAAMSTKTDMNGQYDIMVPPGQYRWIRGVDDQGMAVSAGNSVPVVLTYEFNVPYADKSPLAVKESTIQAIPGLVSISPDPTLGILAGAVHDCDDKETGGAHVEVTEANGAFDSDASELGFYFVEISGSTIPVRTQKWTAENGAFAALNVPPGTGLVTASGIVGSGASKTISTSSVPVIAGAITIVHLVPNGTSM